MKGGIGLAGEIEEEEELCNTLIQMDGLKERMEQTEERSKSRSIDIYSLSPFLPEQRNVLSSSRTQ